MNIFNLHKIFFLSLLLASLLVQALVPKGFMYDQQGTFVVLCGANGSSAQWISLADPDAPPQHNSDDSELCSFSESNSAALTSADVFSFPSALPAYFKPVQYQASRTQAAYAFRSRAPPNFS